MPTLHIAAFVFTASLAAYAHASEILFPEKRGIEIHLENNKNLVEIHVVISKEKYLDSFYEWKNDGAFRKEATETEFRNHAYRYAELFALHTARPMLHGPRSEFVGLPIKVVGDFVEPDDYGHSNTHSMFSFTYNKVLDAKIDWNEFDAASFPRIAPDFRYTPWFTRKCHDER